MKSLYQYYEVFIEVLGDTADAWFELDESQKQAIFNIIFIVTILPVLGRVFVIAAAGVTVFTGAVQALTAILSTRSFLWKNLKRLRDSAGTIYTYFRNFRRRGLKVQRADGRGMQDAFPKPSKGDYGTAQLVEFLEFF